MLPSYCASIGFYSASRPPISLSNSVLCRDIALGIAKEISFFQIPLAQDSRSIESNHLKKHCFTLVKGLLEDIKLGEDSFVASYMQHKNSSSLESLLLCMTMQLWTIQKR
mmetsp:Transcript_8381/g.20171  ORF Transcript_8381/g.20171 Transcript_8381/m.20171 type:complete len:110 (+) Transcript_8381:754-1083(+)